MSDICQDNAVKILLDNLIDCIERSGLDISEEDALEVLGEKFEEFLEDKYNNYDPEKEDSEKVIKRALEILIERVGRDEWYNALRESREITYGSDVGWLYENMSDEIVQASFRELKARLRL